MPSSTLPLFDDRPQSILGTMSHGAAANEDGGLTLDRNKSRSWRHSVGGMAQSVLLKAKASIDTIRGTPLPDPLYVYTLTCRGGR